VEQDVLRRLDKGMKAFVGRCRKKEIKKKGYPHFKGRDWYNSITYSQSGFDLAGNRLNISRIGKLKIKLHRPIEGKIKTCTIVKDGNQWYACFVVEVKPVEKKPIESAIGIDYNLTCLAKLTTGETIENPRWLRRSEKKLIRACRRLSSKKLRGKNRAKQIVRLQAIYRKMRNQRGDFQHKLSNRLVNAYDLIVFEDLSIQNMMKNPYLAKSIADASWNGLCQKIMYKAELRGKYALPVSPRNTSQECSRCGEIVAKTLAVRVHRCSKCGLEMDRDLNASWNILHRGLEEYRRNYGNQRLGSGALGLYGDPRSHDQN